jgi:hypothetical protein
VAGLEPATPGFGDRVGSSPDIISSPKPYGIVGFPAPHGTKQSYATQIGFREFGSKIGSNRNGSSGVEIRFIYAQGHSDLLSAS